MPLFVSNQRVAEFVAYSKTEGQLAPRTAQEYGRDIARFADSLQNKRADQASESDVVMFIAALLDAGLTAGSIARKFFAIRAFYQFLRRRGVRSDDPTENVKLPVAEKGEPNTTLTRDELYRLANVVGTSRFAGNVARDRALMSLLCYAGLKRSEIKALNVSDFDRDNRRLKIGARVIQLAPEAVEPIIEYLSVRPHTRDRSLFVTHTGKRFDVRHIWIIVKKTSFLAGVEKTVDLNAIRRTFAMHWIQDQKDPFVLAQILGLKSLNRLLEFSELAKQHSRDSAFSLIVSVGGVLERYDMRRAQQAWDKVNYRISIGDLDGAITATRTLLESVAKRMLQATGQEAPSSDNLSGLCKRALVAVLPENDPDEHLSKFARTAAGLIEQISLYRNAMGDAHGSAQEREVESAQAQYIVGLAQNTAAFLVRCYASYVDRVSVEAIQIDGPTKVPISGSERDLLQFLLKAALKTASGETAEAYGKLLNSVPKFEKSQRSGSWVITDEDAQLVMSLIPSVDGIGGPLGTAARKLGEKLRTTFEPE